MRITCISLGVFLLCPAPLTAHPDWHICQPFEERINCIVDGDTLWVQGEKMRLRGVDTPETDGHCPRERQLAQQATELHLTLVTSGILSITRFGLDRFGRTLVEIETTAGPVGPTLLASGLADVFGDRVHIDWCQR